MKRILPQANSLSTVIKTFIYCSNRDNYSKKEVADFCGYQPRQADYYINACHYIGLLDNNGCCSMIGRDIISGDYATIKIRTYELILQDEFIGKIFTKLVLYSENEARKYAIEYVNKHYPQYGEAVVNRRASCIVGWCIEILDYIRTNLKI